MYNVSVFNVCSKHSTFSFSFSQLYSQHEPDRTSRRSELTHLSGLLNIERTLVTASVCRLKVLYVIVMAWRALQPLVGDVDLYRALYTAA